MASENVNNNHNDGAAAQAGADEKISVGTFAFSVTPAAITRITDQIGRILEAQVILRGENSLGYGTVTFNTEGEPVEGGAEFTGPAKLGPAARSGKSKSRSSETRTAMRAARPTTLTQTVSPQTQPPAPRSTRPPQLLPRKPSLVHALPEQRRARALLTAQRRPRPGRRGVSPARPSSSSATFPNVLRGAARLCALEQQPDVQEPHDPHLAIRAQQGAGPRLCLCERRDRGRQSKVIEALDGKEINESGLVPASEQSAAAEAPAAPNEDGTPAAGPRKLKLHVRKGYEGQDVEEAEKAEKGANAEEAKNAAAATADGPVA